jgi:hypothetical protein
MIFPRSALNQQNPSQLQYNNECWMMQQNCQTGDDRNIIKAKSAGICPKPSHSCDYERPTDQEFCVCPQGVQSPGCDQCLTGFWAYTSFGCLGNLNLSVLISF